MKTPLTIFRGAILNATALFFHPDYTVGPGITPDHALRLAGFTAGGDLHPALKNCLLIVPLLYSCTIGLSSVFKEEASERNNPEGIRKAPPYGGAFSAEDYSAAIFL